MPGGEQAETVTPSAAVTENAAQRVSCPSCGHLLCRIKQVKESATAGFIIEHMCKGCHRKCDLTYQQGSFSVALLA